MKKNVYRLINPRAKKKYVFRQRIKQAGFIIMGLAVLILLLGIFASWRAKKGDKPISELRYNAGNYGGKVTHLEAKKGEEPGLISKKDKEVYILVKEASDGNDTSVVRLSEKQYEKLQKKIKDSKDSVTVYGYTRYIDDAELKSSITDTAREFYPYEELTTANILGRVGAYYIDYFSSNNIFIILLYVKRAFVIWAVVLLVLGLAVYFCGDRMMKSFTGKQEYTNFGLGALDTEMNQLDAFWFDSINVYVTKNHVIGLGRGIKAVKTADIIWIYVKPVVLLDTQLYQNLFVVNNKGRRIKLSRSKWGNRTNGLILRELQTAGESIRKHNPDVAIGYSSEVQKEMEQKISALGGGK